RSATQIGPQLGRDGRDYRGYTPPLQASVPCGVLDGKGDGGTDGIHTHVVNALIELDPTGLGGHSVQNRTIGAATCEGGVLVAANSTDLDHITSNKRCLEVERGDYSVRTRAVNRELSQSSVHVEGEQDSRLDCSVVRDVERG